MDSSQIKNLMLFELGVENETDFDSNNPLVQKVNQVYDTIKKSLLSSYRWSFSVESAKLTGAEITDNRFKYEFDLPTDFLRVEAVFQDVNEMTIYPDYIVKGKKMYSNKEEIYLRYIKNSGEEDYPDYFIECFKFKGAVALCYNLTGDNQLKQYLEQQFLFFYINAKNVDFRQYSTKIIKSKPYVIARNMGI